MRTRTLFSTACVLLALAMPVLAQPGPGGPSGGPGGGPLGGPGGGPPGGPGGGPQRGGGGPMFGGGGGFGLLTSNTEVKAAVGVSDEQVGKIESLQREFRESFSPPGNPRQQMTQEERTKAFETMRKQMDEHQEKIKAVLTPDQLKKFNVVRFQVSDGLNARGPGLFQALDALELTGEQKAKMEEIGRGMGERMRSMFPPPGEGGERPSREEMQKKMDELDAEIKSKVSGVLTEDQKKLAARLTEEGKELRDSVRQGFRDRREGGRQRGGGEGEYRPNRDSWRPGQGAGGRSDDRPRQGNRRGFPRSQSE